MLRASLVSFAYSDPRLSTINGTVQRLAVPDHSTADVEPSPPASVLIVSDDSAGASRTAEMLGRDARINVCGVASPGKVGAAILRFQPDVVVTNRWFGRSKVDYRDAVAPFVGKGRNIRLVVLDGTETAGDKGASISRQQRRIAAFGSHSRTLVDKVLVANRRRLSAL